ncbi:MAG: hypothetical protein MMC33_010137 [Icmadophila ericetorum]|nr:hypothetical protein [Icmadophila ericetorum]
MPTDHSCTRCLEATPRAECVVAESSSRCTRCTQMGKSCNVKKFSAEELERVSRARERVEAQLSAAEADMDTAVARVHESAQHTVHLQSLAKQSIAKMKRLKTIRDAVSAREHALVRQGMRELDEEDGVSQSVPDFSDFSWEGVLDDPLVFSSGTPVVPSHNGSDS